MSKAALVLLVLAALGCSRKPPVTAPAPTPSNAVQSTPDESPQRSRASTSRWPSHAQPACPFVDEEKCRVSVNASRSEQDRWLDPDEPIRLATADAEPPPPHRPCKPGETVFLDIHAGVSCEEYLALRRDSEAAERRAAVARAQAPPDTTFIERRLGEVPTRSCRKAGLPVGHGLAIVGIAPDGTVTSVALKGPFGDTPVGRCVERLFRGVSVGPFRGAPIVVERRFVVE